MKSTSITSSQNQLYGVFLEVLEAKGIKKHGLAIVAGKKVVDEYLADAQVQKKYLITSENLPEVAGFISSAGTSLAVVELAKALFERLDLFGTKHPLLVVQVPLVSIWDEGAAHDGCVVFVPFQDPSNVGAAVRSAVAMHVRQIVLLEGAAHPYHPKSIRSASGTLLRTQFFKGPPLDELVVGKLPLFALDARGENLVDFKFPKRFGLLSGVEGPGFPRSFVPTQFLSIPMCQGVESLNAMAALTVALYEWRRKLKWEPDRS